MSGMDHNPEQPRSEDKLSASSQKTGYPLKFSFKTVAIPMANSAPETSRAIARCRRICNPD